MVVKAVLFDLGGVLFSPPQRAIAEVEKELGLPRASLAIAFVTGEPNNAFCRLERGELTLSQFFPLFEREVLSVARSEGITFPHGFSARDLFQKMRTSVRPVPAMFRAVSLLKEAGYKTCAITNNWIDDTSNLTDQLDRFLSSHFDVVLQSCRLGLRKPDPRIYQLACQRLGIEPSEAVFLDDLGRNLQPARDMGMATIRVRDAVAALRELERVVGVRLVEEEEEEEEGGRKEAQEENKSVRGPSDKYKESSARPMSHEVKAPKSKL